MSRCAQQVRIRQMADENDRIAISQDPGLAPTETRWIYAEEGNPAFYQNEENIFTVDGRHEFFESLGCWYQLADGEVSFYIADGWIYTAEGKAAFYYG